MEAVLPRNLIVKERQPLGALSKVLWLFIFKSKRDLNVCMKGKVSRGRESRYATSEGRDTLRGAHEWHQASVSLSSLSAGYAAGGKARGSPEPRVRAQPKPIWLSG